MEVAKLILAFFEILIAVPAAIISLAGVRSLVLKKHATLKIFLNYLHPVSVVRHWQGRRMGTPTSDT